MSDLQSIDLWMKPRIDYGPWAEIELVKAWLDQVPTVDEATLFQWYQAAEGATSETPEPPDESAPSPPSATPRSSPVPRSSARSATTSVSSAPSPSPQ